MTDDIKRPSDSELGHLEERVNAVEAALKENTRATLEGNRDAREMLEIFQAVRGGFKVLGWLGAVAKWVGGVLGAVGALYAAWHHSTGGKP